jgi:hypothetical protein
MLGEMRHGYKVVIEKPDGKNFGDLISERRIVN